MILVGMLRITPSGPFTARALVIGLTVGAKAKTEMHEGNRESEAKFRELLGDSVELFGIDLQMQFAGKPDSNECSANTILEDATDIATLESFPVMREGGFSLITFDAYTEQYCMRFVHDRIVVKYYLYKLAVGGRYIMSGRVEMMDFVTPTVDFVHEQNQAVFRSFWEKEGDLYDSGTGEIVRGEAGARAFTLEYLSEHSGVHATIHEPIVVITKNANIGFVSLDERLKQAHDQTQTADE
jgi:hypothetical protein